MSNNAQIEPQLLQTTAFGELSSAENTPVIQITAHHGITDTVLALNSGGTISTENGMYKLESGTSANSVAAVLSESQIQDRPAQGIRSILSFIFSDNSTGNIQQAGLITSEAAFCFAAKDGEFGILYSNNGALEIQDLQITTGAGNESATITIDSVPFTVPLTNNGINTNAYEIATYLDANDARYRYASNGDTVTMIAQLPNFGGGTFSFTSATATGVFTEVKASAIPTDNFTPQSSWNVNPDFDIDHTKGNVCLIQFGYTGFDAVKFSLKNSETGDFEVVHILKYSNSNTVPICSNPVFRIGWVNRNDAATTSSSTTYGASAGAFNEGIVEVLGQSRGVCEIKTISGSVDNNILAIRNRRVFNDEPNRYSITPLSAYLSTESSKITTFTIFKNPTVASGEALEFTYKDEVNSLLEIATNEVEITGGDVIACFPVSSSFDADLSEILGRIPAGEAIAITAGFQGGGSSDVSASISYKDDF